MTAPPDDLPRSRTGRVPQWVRDEAAGRAVTPTPWRAAPDTFRALPEPPRRPRGRNALFVLAVVAVLAGAAAWTVTGHRLPVAPSAPTGPTVHATTTPQAARYAPPVGLEEAPAAPGAPAPLSATSMSFRFKATQPGSPATPVTFSPCRPIHYVVRPDNAPPGGQALLEQAVAAVSQATGLRFIYDGTTVEAPMEDREPYQPGRYGDRWAPVLVSWATADEVPDFGVDIAGEAATLRLRRPTGQYVYVTGEVRLDAAYAAKAIAEQRDGAAAVRAVIAHELGHLVGLAHVNDASQVMYPRTSWALRGYQAGDLTGLAALGRGACAPDI